MTRTLSVWVGTEIIYLYGTVNGESTTFTLVEAGRWEAIVPRTPTDNYVIHLEAYSVNGKEYERDFVLYYGMMDTITDRTETDAREHEQLLARIRKAGDWDKVSSEDKAKFLIPSKGAYNATDYNRVGHNLQYLANVLGGYGYDISVNPKTDWTINNIPKAPDMESYISDLETLKSVFYGTTPLPSDMDDLTVEEANNIEKLLLEIQQNISDMVTSFIYSGEIYSGEV